MESWTIKLGSYKHVSIVYYADKLDVGCLIIKIVSGFTMNQNDDHVVYDFTLDGRDSYDPDNPDQSNFKLLWQCRVVSPDIDVNHSKQNRMAINNTQYDGLFCLNRGKLY